MEVKAIYKNARMSPKKVGEVTRVIQGRTAGEALQMLKFIPRKSAELVRQALASAVANAEHNFNLPGEDMVIKLAVAEMGPAFRRFRPSARGSAHPYRKRTSHIRIILAEAEDLEVA
ncbi:MAG: 50S ribosomal protein L22 [Opitutales bacterium]